MLILCCLLLLLCSVNADVVELYCVKHDSNTIDTCLSSTKPIQAAAVSNQKTETITKNSIRFDLSCKGSSSECQGVQSTLLKAADILSSTFRFESTITINASYFSFCQVFKDCHHDLNLTSIAQAYPTISYIMTDRSDNMTRMYPQPLLKQFTNLTVKPNWAKYDMEAQFNNEVHWYFVNDPNPIKNDQTDFLRNCLHEIMHGLGFISSWDDSFYTSLKPLFDTDTLKPFISPLLLAQVNGGNSLTNYDTQQPFWGFVELPFDKFLYFTKAQQNIASIQSFSSITQQLNQFQHADVVFRSSIDFANAWYASDAYNVALGMYSETTEALETLVMDNGVPLLWLESSIRPFSAGSSLCHVDQSLYLNSADYLMVYTANKGVDISDLNAQYPLGPMGPQLLTFMAKLGYRVNASVMAAETLQPPLAYWQPSHGLAGSHSNPSPSLAQDTHGPARLPKTTTHPIAPSSSMAFLETANSMLMLTCILCIIIYLLHF